MALPDILTRNIGQIFPTKKLSKKYKIYNGLVMNRFTVLNSRTRFNSELSVRLVFMVSFLLHSTVLGALSTAQEIPHLIDPR